jgi:predicted acetyltransferase
MTDLLRRIDAERRESGPLVLSADDVRELVEDDDNICYLADDGVLVYAWDGDDLRVERLAAATAETTRALWAVVASGSSVVRGVYTYASSLDPIHWITDAKARLQVEQERWMMRILDVGKAIALRGYPAAVDAQVPLRLEDAWLSGCAGDFDLSVRGGRGELVAVPERADSERAVRLGPNGLAALYAGTPLHVLEQARLIDGGTAEQYATLATVFAAHPSMIDKF